MALVYGGAGALGKSLVSLLVKKNIKVISIDIAANLEASHNIVPIGMNFQESATFIDGSLKQIIKDDKLIGVFNVAGGWCGGSIKSKDLIQNCESMLQASVHTSIIAGQIASRYMKTGGLLILPGAYAAFQSTPKAIAYGVAKAAVHHLVKSLGSSDSGLPDKSVVVGILPITLDTPMNRKGMPNADFTNWTPTEELAQKIIDWSDGHETPKSGSFIKIETVKGKTSYDLIKHE
jgi:dihydropteridine reductase